MSSPRKLQQAIVLDSIKAVLDKESLGGGTDKWCSRCGNVTPYVDGTFWLYGTDLEWKVRLPVCNCDASPYSRSSADGMKASCTKIETEILPAGALWKEKYLAALFEPDKRKRPLRLADAEMAVVLRTRELFHAQGEHLEERRALDAAMCALHFLRDVADAARKRTPTSINDIRSRIA